MLINKPPWAENLKLIFLSEHCEKLGVPIGLPM